MLQMASFLTVHSDFSVIGSYTYKFIERTLSILGDKNEHYKVKVEACKFLGVLGQHLVKHKDQFVGLEQDIVLGALEELTVHRVLMVQTAAKKTLQIWRRLEVDFEEQGQKKMEMMDDDLDEDELIMKKAGGANLNNLAQRIDHQDMQDSLEMGSLNRLNSIQRGINCYVRNNLVDKTYLKQKAHNFVKKRSGIGGGYVSEVDKSQRQKIRRGKGEKQSFNLIRQKLKNQILNDEIEFQGHKIVEKSRSNQENDEIAEEVEEDYQDEDIEAESRNNHQSISKSSQGHRQEEEVYDQDQEGQKEVQHEEDQREFQDSQQGQRQNGIEEKINSSKSNQRHSMSRNNQPSKSNKSSIKNDRIQRQKPQNSQRGHPTSQKSQHSNNRQQKSSSQNQRMSQQGESLHDQDAESYEEENEVNNQNPQDHRRENNRGGDEEQEVDEEDQTQKLRLNGTSEPKNQFRVQKVRPTKSRPSPQNDDSHSNNQSIKSINNQSRASNANSNRSSFVRAVDPLKNQSNCTIKVSKNFNAGKQKIKPNINRPQPEEQGRLNFQQFYKQHSQDVSPQNSV